MATVILPIPESMPQTVPMNVGDSLYIILSADCSWCFSDPHGVFPDSGHSGCLPKDGPYALQNPPKALPAAKPGKVGDVYFNAVTSGKCDCSPEALHVIRVGVSVTHPKHHHHPE